jgi:hypothetical protein
MNNNYILSYIRGKKQIFKITIIRKIIFFLRLYIIKRSLFCYYLDVVINNNNFLIIILQYKYFTI